MNLQQLVDYAVARHPERPLLDAVDGPTLTYEETRRRARELAAGLADAGDGPIGIVAPNGVAVVEAMLAGVTLGRPVVPVNARAGADELAYYLEDAGVGVLIFDGGIADVVDDARAAVDLDGLVAIGEDAPAWATPLDALRGEPVEPRPVTDEDVATVVYTSGTTGDPKGVPVTHESWVYRALVWVLRDGIVDGDVTGLLLPLYHVIGIDAVLASVQAGATVVIPAGSDPPSILAAIEDRGITTAQGVPTLFHALAAFEGLEGYDRSSLRRLESAGAILTPAVHERVRERLCSTFRNFYGTTEVMNIAYSRTDEPAVGRAADFQELRIVEAETGDPTATLEPGDRGEVIVRADAPEAFDGYLNKPEATEAAIRDGWYFTDDFGYVDEAGRLWLEGRVDDLIISGGENISPSEVEDALVTHPAVAEAGVIGRPDEKWGERVVAFVVAREAVDGAALDAHCRETSGLADFKRPREYHFVDELPKNPTGKVDRAALAERD